MAHLHRNERQIERILDLASRLEGKKRWRVAELAHYYGVHFTRIYDDLRILNRFCFLQNERSLYWIEPGRNPLPTPFTPEEIQALTVVLNASPVKGTRFEEPIQSVLEKLNQPLAERIREAIEETEKISIKIKSGNQYDEIEGHFGVLEQALHEGRVVRATYQAGGKAEPVEHRLQPYAIFFRKEDWYLFAHSNRSKQKFLPFKILRFKDVQLTTDRFEYPEDFSLDEELEKMWELFGGTPIDIKMKIAAHKAYLVEEKQRHPTQKIIERCPDGSVIVSYHVPKQEFSWWVLSLGDAAEVLEPEAFRNEFKQRVRAMYQIYFSSS